MTYSSGRTSRSDAILANKLEACVEQNLVEGSLKIGTWDLLCCFARGLSLCDGLV
jgi:hypothetical protein